MSVRVLGQSVRPDATGSGPSSLLPVLPVVERAVHAAALHAAEEAAIEEQEEEMVEAAGEEEVEVQGYIITQEELRAQVAGVPEPTDGPDAEGREPYCVHEKLAALEIASECERMPDLTSPIKPAHFRTRCIAVSGSGCAGKFKLRRGWPTRSGRALGNVCRNNLVVTEDGSIAWWVFGEKKR